MYNHIVPVHTSSKMYQGAMERETIDGDKHTW